jgi:hypothetical protein
MEFLLESYRKNRRWVWLKQALLIASRMLAAMTEAVTSTETGDIVMVVKPTVCCNESGRVGRVYTVIGVGAFMSKCLMCGHRGPRELKLSGQTVNGKPTTILAIRVIKIDRKSIGETKKAYVGIPATRKKERVV